MSSSADRQLAARWLVRVADGAYSSRLLGGTSSAAVRTRVLGVLRWQRSIDAVLGPHLRRPMEKLDPEVRAVLRLGVFEAVVLGIPVAVATDAAVHLVRRLGFGSASGFVNAVLRRAAPTWDRVTLESPVDIRLSHPGWLYDRWSANFGAEEAEHAMAAGQEPAGVWAWGHEGVSGESASTSSDVVRHDWCPGAWSVPTDAGRVIAAAQSGSAYIQDPSSQLVVHVALRLWGGGAAVDLCAAPGGKTALWSRLTDGAPIAAFDRRLSRVVLMGPRLARQGTTWTAVADGAQPPLRPAEWDLVLVDAPCSGTGTLRRHPEIKWRLRQEDITSLARVQSRILAGAVDLLAEGGVLLYSTCSVEPEENEELFDPMPRGVEPADLAAVIPEGVPWIPTSAGGARILPNPLGDGFTLHALRSSR